MNYFAYPHAGAWAVVYLVPGTMALHVHEVGFARVELAKVQRLHELLGMRIQARLQARTATL